MLFFVCVFVFVVVFNSAPTVCLGPWPLILIISTRSRADPDYVEIVHVPRGFDRPCLDV